MSGVGMMRDFRAAQTPVRSQGARGTCAVFAATAAHEWMAADGPDLSEEDALCSAKQIAPGPGDATWVSCALAGIDQQGHALSSDWPYGTPHYLAGRPAAATDPARRRRCGAISSSTAATVADIADLVAGGDAVVITVAFVPATWAAATGNGWIDDPDPPARGAHAVLVVGALGKGDRPPALIFKNSWTPSWGDRGYGFMTDRYLGSHHRLTDVLGASP